MTIAHLRRTTAAVFVFGLSVSGVVSTQAEAQRLGAYSNYVFGGAPNDLFGAVALPAPLGRYQDQWERARQSAVANPRLQALVAPARSLPRLQQIAFVQAAVHRQIHWMSDATEWGQHDYWASASQTLDRGAGDMEDRDIVKMQALIALGFNPDDLFLTLGRDKVGGPMSMLVVRIAPERYVTLDDLGGDPMLADRREGFKPTMSLSSRGSWIHGYRVASRAGAGN